MVASNPTLEAERTEGDLPRPLLDGIYLTRFDTYETEDGWAFRSRMPNVQLVQVETVMHHGELVIFGKVRLGLEVMPDTTSQPLCFYHSFPISGEENIDKLSANLLAARRCHRWARHNCFLQPERTSLPLVGEFRHPQLTIVSRAVEQ